MAWYKALLTSSLALSGETASAAEVLPKIADTPIAAAFSAGRCAQAGRDPGLGRGRADIG